MRKFGIEIEYSSCQYHSVGKRKYKWKYGTDSSVPCLKPHTCELRSPPLKSYRSIKSICNYISKDFFVNKNCGLHIHINFPYRYKNKINILIKLMKKHEITLFKICGRPPNFYCKRIKNIRNPSCDRYRSLNTNGYLNRRRPTVEFRLFKSTCNSDIIITYVKLCQSLVNKALSNKKILNSKTSDINSLFKEINWDNKKFKKERKILRDIYNKKIIV